MNSIFDGLLGEARVREAVDSVTGSGDRYIMLVAIVRGNIVYLADGMEKDLEYMTSTLEKMAQFRLERIAVAEDVDMDTMRRNSNALNEKYGHLIK